ncbi:MAG: hypothetical protein Q7R96_04670 [Nanoarchaeota archaeon]|nr:hypothetical protein [Nanoarchaeota archaeon]
MIFLERCWVMIMGIDAQELVHCMQAVYARDRYHQHFSVPGVAFFYNPIQESWNDAPGGSGLELVVRQIVDSLRNDLVRPSCYVPRVRDEFSHYQSLWLANVDLLSLALLESSESDPRVIDMVNDHRLLQEAVTQYHDAVLPAKVDFFDFLLHYHDEYVESDPPAGKYRSLLERMVVRAGDADPLSLACAVVSDNRYRWLVARHEDALAVKKMRVRPAVQELFDRLVVHPVVNEDPHPVIATLGSLLGKRRVRMGAQWNPLIDWSAYGTSLLDRRGAVHLDVNAVRERQIVNALVQEYLPVYRSAPAAACRAIESAIKQSSNEEEKKALNTTLRLLQNMVRFAASSKIKHTLQVTRKVK